MTASLSPEQLDELKRYPTPTVCNAIEMFDVRPRNEGFMLPGIECRFPELDPIVGYAATATFSAQEPARPGVEVDMGAYYEHILAQPAPRILIAEDLDERPIGALFGECNGTLHQALGCVGHVTNGGVRDLDETRSIGFQFFSGCVQVSHAYVHLEGFGQPVTVGGITVGPGDLIHADKHGVCLIPHEAAPRLADACAAMEELERPQLELARTAEFTPARYLAAREQFRERFAEAANEFACE